MYGDSLDEHRAAGMAAFMAGAVAALSEAEIPAPVPPDVSILILLYLAWYCLSRAGMRILVMRANPENFVRMLAHLWLMSAQNGEQRPRQDAVLRRLRVLLGILLWVPPALELSLLLWLTTLVRLVWRASLARRAPPT